MDATRKNTSAFLDGHIDRSTWKRVRLGDYATLFAGGTPSRAVSDYYGGTIPWCSISDISNAGKFLTRTEESLTSLGLEKSSAKLIPADAILFAMYASIGECSLATTPLATSQAILGIYNLKGFDREYLYYYLCSRKDAFINQGQTGTQSNLSKEILSNLQLPKPEIEEQCSIAVSLSTIDTNISALQSLIAKYEAIKKATVNLLLKPKDGWKRVKLGDVFEVKVGGDLDFPHYSPYKTIDCRYEIVSNSLTNHGHYGYTSLPNFPGDSITVTGRGNVGHAEYRQEPFDAIVRIVILSPNCAQVCSKFVAELINATDTFLIESTGVPQLTAPQIASTSIALPPLDEQKRIVAILDSIDGTINGLKSQLAKAQDIKQGMMSYFFG